MEIRKMAAADLDEVAAVSDGAFIAVIGGLTGQRLARPFFPPAGLAQRLATDPDGCLVALESGRLLGAIFSVRRGTLAWFGPVAVDPAVQGRGIGQALIQECLGLWAVSGVRLMGLETFGQSPGHVHLYSRLGFRPGWVGVNLRKRLDPAPGSAAAGTAPPLQHPALPLPALDFLYPGFDAGRDVRATIEHGAGRVFASDHGLAILHLRNALHASEEEAFVPLLAADGPEAFLSLVEACEEAARAEGRASIATRLPGAAAGAYDALVRRGYRPGGTMLRMKAGAGLDYDSDAWYCDDWL